MSSQSSALATWPLMAARPAVLERVHVVPALELVKRLGVVLTHRLDDDLQRVEVHVPLGEPLHVAGERRRVIRLKPAHR